MKTNLLKENISIALTAIKAQMSRAIITALIISFGIMALVGILTATDAIQQSITGEFSALGATTFSISNRERGIFIGRRGTKPKTNPLSQPLSCNHTISSIKCSIFRHTNQY